MSFLIDPPWLYANGRAYAALAPERAQGRTAAAAGAATMAVFWARERLALPQPPLDAADLGGCAARATGATGCSTRASCASTTQRAGPGTHAVGAPLFATYPLLALARLARRAAD